MIAIIYFSALGWRLTCLQSIQNLCTVHWRYHVTQNAIEVFCSWRTVMWEWEPVLNVTEKFVFAGEIFHGYNNPNMAFKRESLQPGFSKVQIQTFSCKSLVRKKRTCFQELYELLFYVTNFWYCLLSDVKFFPTIPLGGSWCWKYWS